MALTDDQELRVDALKQVAQILGEDHPHLAAWTQWILTGNLDLPHACTHPDAHIGSPRKDLNP